MTRRDGFADALASVALMIALVFAAGPTPAAAASQQNGPVVALANGSGAETLVKASARSLFRSADGGRSWQEVAIGSLKGGKISSLAVSPASKDVMYVAGPGLGVLRRNRGGKAWVERNKGLPSRAVVAIAAHTTQPDTLYAFVEEQGIYRSQNAGRSWRLMDRRPQDGLRQLIHSNMAGSMKTGWLFTATAKGVGRIMDCFCLWQDAGKLGTRAYGVTYDPRQPEHIYTATEKGLFRSANGGEDWVQMTSPGSEVAALAFTHSGTLFVISADGDLYRSEDEGGSWKR
jgi:photosystem II stability/assembly factor-like uncharacterized protein